MKNGKNSKKTRKKNWEKIEESKKYIIKNSYIIFQVSYPLCLPLWPTIRRGLDYLSFSSPPHECHMKRCVYLCSNVYY